MHNMSIEARKLARESATMDISDWRACSDFTSRSNPEVAERGLSFDYHCIRGYANVFELGKFWAPDEEDLRVLAATGSDASASPLVRAQALSTRGYLLAARGDLAGAALDYQSGLALAKAATPADRRRLEWLMTSSEGVSTGPLLDNIYSELSHRLEALTVSPLPESSKDLGSGGAQLQVALDLAADGNWRTSTDLLRKSYEEACGTGSTPDTTHAAFTAYADSFRLAEAVPSHEDMEFLEQVAADSSSPPLVKAQAWTLRGLMAWSWDMHDTARWQLDEAVQEARNFAPGDENRDVAFVDYVYGGMRNVRLHVMLDAAVEDAAADREELSGKRDTTSFSGLSTHVFAPQDRAFTHQFASFSGLPQPQEVKQNSVENWASSVAIAATLLMLVAPLVYSLYHVFSQNYRRWKAAIQDLLRKRSAEATQVQTQLRSGRRASNITPKSNRKNGNLKRRVATQEASRDELKQEVVFAPDMVKVKEAPPLLEPQLSLAAATAAVGAAGMNFDDDTEGRCKVCFDGPCERGFFHGGSVHAGICRECADAVMATPTPLCPFCRVHVDACVQIFS